MPTHGVKVATVTEIVILALIAAFLGLRLYSVLGRRAEHEEETIAGRFDAGSQARPSNVVPMPKPADRLAPPQGREREMQGVMAPADRALREIAAVDRRFDLLTFLAGAEGAYRMILEAYWRGDKEELSHLCDRDVYEGFCAAIDARNAAGEVLDNRLVRIEEAVVAEASFNAPMARITVRFRSDIAAVTRDASGTVIAGSLTDAVEAIDVWTFSRNVKSASLDWLLDETDEG
ncbi:preprotein translocase subunit Tim44 [Novosphingobium sp. TH158]|nr:preprotein translocase subunit Tim44 [Novosphingobium sp. TH158]